MFPLSTMWQLLYLLHKQWPWEKVGGKSTWCLYCYRSANINVFFNYTRGNKKSSISISMYVVIFLRKTKSTLLHLYISKSNVFLKGGSLNRYGYLYSLCWWNKRLEVNTTGVPNTSLTQMPSIQEVLGWVRERVELLAPTSVLGASIDS